VTSKTSNPNSIGDESATTHGDSVTADDTTSDKSEDSTSDFVLQGRLKITSHSREAVAR